MVRSRDSDLNNIKSQWESLLGSAFQLICHVNRNQPVLTDWSLGGGTAMMIHIGHRESFDIDLFIDDPQLLGYIRASASTVDFGDVHPATSGNGATFFRIAFQGKGEIDFIVAPFLTAIPFKTVEFAEQRIKLETVEEIIAKKVRYRGSMIQARDVFDIAAACQAGYLEKIRQALETIPEYREQARLKLQALSADYINKTISQLMIRPEFEALKLNSIDIALEALSPN
jgi:Nucleotidyl transferase AbiEii toxin, Type IV TA system